MKQVIITCLLPFIISITTVYYLAINKPVNDLLFRKTTIEKAGAESEYRFIENFDNNPAYEDQFLKSSDSSETIFLLGSSELTSSTPAIPYNFISDHFTAKLKGVGHAGNQCLSIYAQLLAKEQYLKNAPIVIILSPGWFESKPSKGTSSAIFLEFNSERSLNKILKNESNSEFHSYLYERIAQLYNEFNSPNLELKLMNFKHRASKSFIQTGLYAPIIFCDNVLLNLKEKITSETTSNIAPIRRQPINQDSVSINWDSLYALSKEEVIKRSTNNNMGIEDNYYTEYIHGKSGQMEPVHEMFNKELEDFKMLIKLLKEKKANASFIISPLNPFYYKNLKDLTPTMNIIEAEIRNKGFSCLNLLEMDTSKYEKPILNDVMHMSDYGWYKVDRFIIDTYNLSR